MDRPAPSAEVNAALRQRGRCASLTGSALVLLGLLAALMGAGKIWPFLLPLAAGITLVLYGQVMAMAGAEGGEEELV